MSEPGEPGRRGEPGHGSVGGRGGTGGAGGRGEVTGGEGGPGGPGGRVGAIRQWSHTARVSRVIMWVLLVLVSAFLFGRQEGTIDRIERDEKQAIAESREVDGRLALEARTRERELCGIVINLHEATHLARKAARQSLRSERRRLASTRIFLAGPGAQETPELAARVRATLPNTKNDVRVAKARVRVAKENQKATAPPPTCREYLPEGGHHGN